MIKERGQIVVRASRAQEGLDERAGHPAGGTPAPQWAAQKAGADSNP